MLNANKIGHFYRQLRFCFSHKGFFSRRFFKSSCIIKHSRPRVLLSLPLFQSSIIPHIFVSNTFYYSDRPVQNNFDFDNASILRQFSHTQNYDTLCYFHAHPLISSFISISYFFLLLLSYRFFVFLPNTLPTLHLASIVPRFIAQTDNQRSEQQHNVAKSKWNEGEEILAGRKLVKAKKIAVESSGGGDGAASVVFLGIKIAP